VELTGFRGVVGRPRSLTSSALRADNDAMAIDRSVTRPGGYAQRRYQRGLESWRRKLTPVLAGVFGPFLIAGFVVLIVERQLLSWFAGMIFGVLVGVWLWLRDSPPRYVEKWRIKGTSSSRQDTVYGCRRWWPAPV
jgi:hypothetical protein